MRVLGDRTILLMCSVLRGANIELAKSQIHALKGKTVVEMQPVPRMSGGLLIANSEGSERRLRPDIGQLLAIDENNPELNPGDFVVVDHRHGRHYTGFESGKYKAKYQVRVLGVARQVGTKHPIRIHWSDSILGLVNTMKFPVQTVEASGVIPISKVNTHGVYESYIFTESGNITVPSLHGAYFCPAVVPTGKTLRLVVTSDDHSRTVDVKCEEIGDGFQEFVELLDLERPIKAVGKRIFIELDELHDQSEGGVMLTDRSAFRSTWATVLSVGGAVSNGAKPGMKVLVSAEGMEDCMFIQHLNPHRRPWRLVHEDFVDLIHPDSKETAA